MTALRIVVLSAGLAACSKPAHTPERAFGGAPEPTHASPAPAASVANTAASHAATAAPVPIPTPKLAGSDPCQLGPTKPLSAVPKGRVQGNTSVELGFGASGGLAVWQAEPDRVYTRRVDASGTPLGVAASFAAPKHIILKRVHATSRGYLIVGEDFSDYEMGHWFAWTTDELGAILERVAIDSGPHGFDALSKVVNDRILVYLSNDRLNGDGTSRVVLLDVSSGRIEQRVFDFPVVTPIYHAPMVEIALGANDWAVWVVNAEPLEGFLLRPGAHVRAALPKLPQTLFANYYSIRLRFDGSELKLLTALADARENVTVVESPEGDAREIGARAGSTVLRVVSVSGDGSTTPVGEPFEFTGRTELPAPFANEIDFSLGTKTANRMTLIGVNELTPISLEGVTPPLTDPMSEAAHAWSGTHWVVAYFSAAAETATDSMNVFGIRCGE